MYFRPFELAINLLCVIHDMEFRRRVPSTLLHACATLHTDRGKRGQEYSYKAQIRQVARIDLKTGVSVLHRWWSVRHRRRVSIRRPPHPPAAAAARARSPSRRAWVSRPGAAQLRQGEPGPPTAGRGGNIRSRPAGGVVSARGRQGRPALGGGTDKAVVSQAPSEV